MAAYVDLLMNAEYALPKGTENFSDPLNPDIWKTVQLGGKYKVGDSSTSENIIITLTSRRDGYYVESAKAVSNDEYASFQKHMKAWRKQLQEYYEVFK